MFNEGMDTHPNLEGIAALAAAITPNDLLPHLFPLQALVNFNRVAENQNGTPRLIARRFCDLFNLPQTLNHLHVVNFTHNNIGTAALSFRSRPQLGLLYAFPVIVNAESRLALVRPYIENPADDRDFLYTTVPLSQTNSNLVLAALGLTFLSPAYNEHCDISGSNPWLSPSPIARFVYNHCQTVIIPIMPLAV